MIPINHAMTILVSKVKDRLDDFYVAPVFRSSCQLFQAPRGAGLSRRISSAFLS